MKPSQLSKELVSIADRINRSTNPSRAKVATALHKILASLHVAQQEEEEQQQQCHAQQEQQDQECYAQERMVSRDVPESVERYVKEVKKDNPSYSDAQAWATAWSIYCKNKNPGSPHCKS